jgi:hypothetical protein
MSVSNSITFALRYLDT